MAVFMEADMYEPVKSFFEKLGYTVKGEVKNCDIVATKEDDIIIVEMKKSFNMTLLFQVIERQGINWNTYVAIPRPRSSREKNFRHVKHIAEKLEFGLMTVAMDSPVKIVEIIKFPSNSHRKASVKAQNTLKGIIKEAALRNFDNKGGSSRTKLNTAFREKSVKIACVLRKFGPMRAKDLVNLYSCDKYSGRILSVNHYGWFYRVDKGIYDLTCKGVAELNDNSLARLVDYYSERI